MPSHQGTMRKAIFIIHQYLGFTLGVYLIVICATGALLILFENQINEFRDYPMQHVSMGAARQPLEAIVASVRQAYPADAVAHVLISCPRGCTYDVTVRGSHNERLDVLVDPYTAKIIRSVTWAQSPIGFLYELHANLFSGDSGSMINSVIGLVAVFQILAGLYLWPGWLRFWRGFSIKWRADRWRLNFDLHKVTGIVAFAFLIFMVCTGAAGVIFAEPPTDAPLVPQPRHAPKPLSLDALVERADLALPGQVTMVYPAQASSSLVRVRKVVSGDPDPYGWSNVALDQYTGRVVAVYDAAKWPLWWRTYTYFYPLHIGSLGGMALRYLYVVLATAPIVLYFTAFLMWLNRIRRDEAVATRVGRMSPTANAR
jgi:uncharacterized iron-regulated membrane protein